MKLKKVVDLLSDLDKKCSKKSAIKLDFKEVVLTSKTGLVISFKDKKK